MLKHYVEFYFPGSFVSESSVKPVLTRETPTEIPEGAYGYRFFSRQEVESNGEILRGRDQDRSPMTYFGEVMTVEQVAAMPGDNRILLSNMRCNEWDRVVRTVRGIFQPLYPGDIVIRKEPA